MNFVSYLISQFLLLKLMPNGRCVYCVLISQAISKRLNIRGNSIKTMNTNFSCGMETNLEMLFNFKSTEIHLLNLLLCASVLIKMNLRGKCNHKFKWNFNFVSSVIENNGFRKEKLLALVSFSLASENVLLMQILCANYALCKN